jgi:uncharacterized membrane protein
MHGFGFFPGMLLFGPALLFIALFKILFFVLLIMLIVRLVTHGRRHGAAAGYGHGHHHGHHHGGGSEMQDLDPRRIAAWRYASGKIDRAEFDRVIAGLDAANIASAAAPAPPADAAPQA